MPRIPAAGLQPELRPGVRRFFGHPAVEQTAINDKGLCGTCIKEEFPAEPREHSGAAHFVQDGASRYTALRKRGGGKEPGALDGMADCPVLLDAERREPFLSAGPCCSAPGRPCTHNDNIPRQFITPQKGICPMAILQRGNTSQ